MSRGFGKQLLAMLTILAIAGTLTSCGRYGKPIRPVEAPEQNFDRPAGS